MNNNTAFCSDCNTNITLDTTSTIIEVSFRDNTLIYECRQCQSIIAQETYEPTDSVEIQ